MEHKQIVYNAIKTPDGTILESMHRHDYVEYVDKNSQFYMVDGGLDYLRRGYDINDFEELSLYIDDDFEKIRKAHKRGGRGKDGKQPLTWIPLCEMSNSWLDACIVYNTEKGMQNNFTTKLYVKELIYRKENNIFIEDEKK